MTNYIKITENMSALINQFDLNVSQIEVKGESVKYLFTARMLIKEILENQISEEDLFKSKSSDKKEDST